MLQVQLSQRTTMTTDVMDIRAEFDRLIEEMDWDEVIENVKDMVDDMMGETSSPDLLPPPSPLSMPALPAEMWFSPQPQSVGGEYFGFKPDDGAAPYRSIRSPPAENVGYGAVAHSCLQVGVA